MWHPSTNEMVERKIEVHKDKSLREATEDAYKEGREGGMEGGREGGVCADMVGRI